jgi:hypothetical protein
VAPALEDDEDLVRVAGEIDGPGRAEDLADALRRAGGDAEVAFGSVRVRFSGVRIDYEAAGGGGWILVRGFETGPERRCLPAFSDAMGRRELRHRFEIYEGEDLVGYLHQGWPQDG